MVVQNTCPADSQHNGVEDDHQDDQPGLQENGVGGERIGREPSTNSVSDTGTSDEEPEENDLNRLKELVPSVSAKDNVTQLDIILEAIRYIDSLQNRLADKIENGEIELLKVPVKKFKEN